MFEENNHFFHFKNGIIFWNYNRMVAYKLSFVRYWYFLRENQLIKADSNAHHDVRKSKFLQHFDKNLYFIDCNPKFRRHINSLWIDVFSPLISGLYSHKVADLVVIQKSSKMVILSQFWSFWKGVTLSKIFILSHIGSYYVFRKWRVIWQHFIPYLP